VEDADFPLELEKVVKRSFVETDSKFAETFSQHKGLSSGTTALTAMIFGRYCSMSLSNFLVMDLWWYPLSVLFNSVIGLEAARYDWKIKACCRGSVHRRFLPVLCMNFRDYLSLPVKSKQWSHRLSNLNFSCILA
jgi:hypothetical protein